VWGGVAPNAEFSIACPVSFRGPAFALVAAGLAIFVAPILKSDLVAEQLGAAQTFKSLLC